MKTQAGPEKIILHQDDVGVSHGSNIAFLELSNLGTCSSGSVMVPCPWFLESVDLAIKNPELDLGVHLTLTSEKEFYKWRPITNPPRSAGLTDDNGFMWADIATLRKHANVDAVEIEMRAQIDTALNAGLDVTHIDSHMGATLTQEFGDIFVTLGIEYKLPLLLTPSIQNYAPRHNLVGVDDLKYQKSVKRARENGFPIFDSVLETYWKDLPDVEAVYRSVISETRGGLTFFACHFNAPGDIELIDPEGASQRIAEYNLFRSTDFKTWLVEQNKEIIGFRKIRDDLRKSWSKRAKS